MSEIGLADSVAAFCAAAQTNDVDGMVGALASDAELISPLFGLMVFRGRGDLRVLLGAAFASLHRLSWRMFVGEGQIDVAVGEARVAGRGISGMMVFELDDDGRIARIRPNLWPWVALSVFALLLGVKLARYPGVIERALRTQHR